MTTKHWYTETQLDTTQKFKNNFKWAFEITNQIILV